VEVGGRTGSCTVQPERKKSGSGWKDRFMYCTKREIEVWKWVGGQVMYHQREIRLEVGRGTGNVQPERKKSGSRWGDRYMFNQRERGTGTTREKEEWKCVGEQVQPERMKNGNGWGTGTSTVHPERKKSGSGRGDKYMSCPTREKEEWKWVGRQVYVLYNQRERRVEVGEGTGTTREKEEWNWVGGQVQPERKKSGSGWGGRYN
jgi:hypothetical protein